jgi:hypothetical protein
MISHKPEKSMKDMASTSIGVEKRWILDEEQEKKHEGKKPEQDSKLD